MTTLSDLANYLQLRCVCVQFTTRLCTLLDWVLIALLCDVEPKAVTHRQDAESATVSESITHKSKLTDIHRSWHWREPNFYPIFYEKAPTFQIPQGSKGHTMASAKFEFDT